jgi:hypothetical protein
VHRAIEIFVQSLDSRQSAGEHAIEHVAVRKRMQPHSASGAYRAIADFD